MSDPLVETWEINARINDYVLAALHPRRYPRPRAPADAPPAKRWPTSTTSA